MKNKIFFLLLATLLLFSCGEKNNDTQKPVINTQKAEKIIDEELTVTSPWIRAAAKGMNSAMFLTIINNTSNADTLIGAEADFAEIVEIHESFKASNDMMGMRRIDELPIAPYSTVHLKPMSYHIMLIKLTENIHSDSLYSVNLIFQKGVNYYSVRR